MVFTDKSDPSLSKFPLHLSAKNRDVSKIKKLIKKGTSVNALDDSKQTALHIAASDGSTDLIKTLVDSYKANIEARDKNGWTCLHCACYYGHLEASEMLLDRGANVFALTNDGDTPLHYLVRPNCTNPALFEKIFYAFIQKGIDIQRQNVLGDTPLHAATRKGRDVYVRLLVRHNVNVNTIDSYGETPLHSACRIGSVEICKMLLEAGAEPTVSGKEGTARDIATRAGQMDLIELMDNFEYKFRPRSQSLSSLIDSGHRKPLPVVPTPQVTSRMQPMNENGLTEEKLVGVLQKYSSKTFLLFPDPKSKKLGRAKKKCQLPSGEKVIAFAAANSGPMNTLAKEVVLFGLKGVYSYIGEKTTFSSYQMIMDCDLKKRHSSSNEVHLGYNKYCSILGLDGEQVLRIFRELREAIQSQSSIMASAPLPLIGSSLSPFSSTLSNSLPEFPSVPIPIPAPTPQPVQRQSSPMMRQASMPALFANLPGGFLNPPNSFSSNFHPYPHPHSHTANPHGSQRGIDSGTMMQLQMGQMPFHISGFSSPPRTPPPNYGYTSPPLSPRDYEYSSPPMSPEFTSPISSPRGTNSIMQPLARQAAPQTPSYLQHVTQQIRSGNHAALAQLALHPNHEEAYNTFLSILDCLYSTSLNGKDQNGRTPFHYAALSGNQQLFLSFHSFGADPTIPDLEGKTPFAIMQDILGYELDERFSQVAQMPAC